MSERADAKEESLSIPKDVRAAVDERDQQKCRVCGKYLGERRALHHVIYGGDAVGMGGRRKHDVEAIATVCWLPGDGDCHLLVHSRKAYFQDLLLEVLKGGNTTVYQLERWRRRRAANAASAARRAP